MDFLNTLYSNDNFGIILFIVISILVLAFLIVLFFGKKDQKERKLAETKSLEVNNTLAQNAFRDEQPTVQLNIDPKIFERPTSTEETEIHQDSPLINNTVMNEVPSLDNLVEVEDNLMSEVPTPEFTQPVEENYEPPKMNFDFDALADSISKELESITEQEEKINIEKSPIIEDEPLSFVEPIIKEDKELNPLNMVDQSEMKPVIEEEPERIVQFEPTEKPKMPSPTQFSSVFVNKKNEEPIEQMKPITEEVTPVVTETTPAKPKIELPKTIDLPKLNSNQGETNHSNIVFSSLESDIENYPRNNGNGM